MKKSNQKLGKGLEALLGVDVNEMINDIENNYQQDSVVKLKLKQISPNPFQPRKVFDQEKIDELARSIKEHGVFTPLIVQKASDNHYNIIAGERRYRACQSIELDEIPAIVVEMDERAMMEIALLENIQREDLNSIEEAQALKLLMDKYSYTQEQLATKMGKSRSHIANTLRLLSLSKKVQDLVLDQKITMGHAKVLVGLEDLSTDIVLNEVIAKNLSVRECEKLVMELKNPKVKKSNRTQQDVEIVKLEEVLRDHLQTKIKLTNNSLNISYEDIDDLNRILTLLNIKVD